MDNKDQPHRTHWRGNDEMAARRAKAEAEATAERGRSDRRTWLLAGLLFVGTFVGGLAWLNSGSLAQATDNVWQAPPAAASDPPSLPVAFASPIGEEARAPTHDPVYYSGCNEVRALGRAPLYYNQPGYRPEMDGDSDGIACEPHI